MHITEFEKLVQQGVLMIPQKFRDKLDNVVITVAEEPSAEQLSKLGYRQGTLLFGLYEGVPQLRRGVHYNMAIPDRITIFKNPIERVARTPEQIKQKVRDTVYHEIAHHFGMDEKEIRLVEKKRLKRNRLE